MSTVRNTVRVSPTSDATCQRPAHFATRWLQPGLAVIIVHGELDASNANEFVDYPLRHAEHTQRLVVDLRAVSFFGTAGFSALHAINVGSARARTNWALVPSAMVTRLLEICDPDCALPIARTVEDAASALATEPHRLLQLVSQSR